MRYIMDRRSSAFAAVLALMLPFVAHCWSTVHANSGNARAQRNEISPYIDLVLCPIRDQPWSCARQQSARILDVWDGEVHSQWQKLKAEADRQLNATIEKRGYSGSEVLTKEKPSTILKKIEIGTNYMKEYLAETMDGFLGREYEYMGNGKHGNKEEESEDDDDDEEADEEEEEEEDANDNNDDNDNDDDDDLTENDNDHHKQHMVQQTDSKNNQLGESEADEFIEIEDTDKNGQLKRPGGGGGKGKRKKKKKGGSASQPATLVVVQPLEQHDDHDHGGGEEIFGGHGGKPLKQKRKKRKKHQQGDDSIVVVEQEASDHLGLGLLEELVGGGDDLLSSGGKRKNKHPSKYGRSNGVTRGKKKKKKKALMKLVLLGTFLKAKIELLLKILGAHLQIKFFAIALIGLLINIARFWIDVKRGGAPQKVVYVEHAHHQHHYEEQGGDDWGEQGGGSYWKRSLQTDPTVEQGIASTDSYQPARLQQPADAQYMAYRNQWQ